MYILFLIFKTKLLANLAYFGQLTKAIANTALIIFGPNNPATAIARTNPGKEIIISANLIIIVSAIPPKYPANIPSPVPTTNTTVTKVNVIINEGLIP